MGNEESGMIEEGGEGGDGMGNLPRGGRRGAARGSDTGGSTGGSSLNSNNGDYGDYGSKSSSTTKPRGGRRGRNQGSSNTSNHDSSSTSNYGSGSTSNYGSGSTSNYGSGSTSNYNSGASASKPAPSSDLKGGDDLFSDMDLPLGETPKSIGKKGRKAFNQAIWSPRGADSKRSKAPERASNKGSADDALNKSLAKLTGGTNAEKSKPDPEKKSTFNFDSLYYGQSKPKSEKVAKSQVDDGLFSTPFGVSGGGGAQKETKSRSINVDIKMGNSALKDKVRGDRRRKEQQKNKSTFHRPKADVTFDAFDDLEEEMIGEGVIGNGNKKTRQMERTASVAPVKQLQWNAGNAGSSSSQVSSYGGSSSSQKRDRDKSGGDDGWF